MKTILLSNFDAIDTKDRVIVKRQNELIGIYARDLNMFENIYTLDGILIANRIK